jgi:hypothetical protein
MPAGWLLSRLCQEFGATPAQIRREDPAELWAIMTDRVYARTKAEMRSPHWTEADSSSNRWGVDMVMAFQAERLTNGRNP